MTLARFHNPLGAFPSFYLSLKSCRRAFLLKVLHADVEYFLLYVVVFERLLTRALLITGGSFSTNPHVERHGPKPLFFSPGDVALSFDGRQRGQLAFTKVLTSGKALSPPPEPSAHGDVSINLDSRMDEGTHRFPSWWVPNYSELLRTPASMVFAPSTLSDDPFFLFHLRPATLRVNGQTMAPPV